MQTLTTVALATGQATKQHVSGEMLVAVFAVAFTVAFLIAALIKGENGERSVKTSLIVGGAVGFTADMVTIMVIAARHM